MSVFPTPARNHASHRVRAAKVQRPPHDKRCSAAKERLQTDARANGPASRRKNIHGVTSSSRAVLGRCDRRAHADLGVRPRTLRRVRATPESQLPKVVVPSAFGVWPIRPMTRLHERAGQAEAHRLLVTGSSVRFGVAARTGLQDGLNHTDSRHRRGHGRADGPVRPPAVRYPTWGGNDG